MRIVVDAMGSDNRPKPDIEGAVMASRELSDTIILVGDQSLLESHLNQHPGTHPNIEIVHAEDEILMTDKPSIIGRSKPNSSMHIGMNLVKNGDADAFVTVGNTGAAHAIAMLYTLKRIAGVKRPALSSVFPINNHPIIFLDIGANTDPKPDWMVQFAIMGSIYANNALGMLNPRVGVLSNGEEEGKGNQLIRETNTALEQLHFINYIGNIEPVDIMHGGVDVVVTDGFTGNILLKTFEASARYITGIIRDEIKSDVLSMLGGLLSRPAFRRVRNRVDTSKIGGAPLLGVNGIVIIGHGSSNAIAIKNAIHQAHQAVKGQVIEAIQDGLALTTA